MDRNKERVIGNQVDGKMFTESDKTISRDTKRDQ